MPNKSDISSGQQTLALQQALDIAVEHHQAGDLLKAEGIYQKIIQAAPDHSQAVHLLGVIAHQRGQNEKSVELIIKALNINPEFAEAHNNLGIIHIKNKELYKAIERFEQSIAADIDFIITSIASSSELKEGANPPSSPTLVEIFLSSKFFFKF